MKPSQLCRRPPAAGIALPPRSASRAGAASCTAAGRAARWLQGFGVCLLLAAGSPACAHELQDSRATLVQREANFVAMTLYIDLPTVLHRTIAPGRTFTDFAAEQTQLSLGAFRAVLLQAVGRLQAEMRVTTAKGTALAFERWTWPDATRVQAALRERLMEAVVAPGEHAHAQPLEVRAELHSALPVPALRVKFAPALGRVLVVSYRPRQVWVDARRLSPDITF